MAQTTFERCCNAPGPGDTHCTHPGSCMVEEHEDQHADVSWPKDEAQDHACDDERCVTNAP